MTFSPPKIGTVQLASGGRIGLIAMPGRDGSFDADVENMIAWRPDHVVSLADPAELQSAGAAGLGNRLTARKIRWAHFPIADFGVPDASAHRAWDALSTALSDDLAEGRSVLLHCQAGLGRSGMIALKLMVMAGEDPAAALARLRLARPGAVETDAQLAWAIRKDL
jgi:protein-tyrosine phosphatase